MAKRIPKQVNATQHDKKPVHKGGKEFFIEALIVLDYSMVNYHEEVNIENYILTVFNMVCIIHILLKFNALHYLLSKNFIF